MNKYLKLFDKILTDFLNDLRSLRFWLVVFGFIFNIYVLQLTVYHNLDYKVSISAIALLSAIYTYFFMSKRDEHSNKGKVDED